MAETQRTRAQLLANFADNVTGQISPEDLRDFLVTVMETEFVNPGDFFNRPLPDEITTDKTTRGWHIYSQVMLSACSFGNVLFLTESNTWGTGDVADSARNPIQAVATDSYAAAESQAKLLRGFIGRPVYLQSALNGSISVTIGTSVLELGTVLPNGVGSVVSGKWYFKPEWSVKGI
jgi:hypothetical protein